MYTPSASDPDARRRITSILRRAIDVLGDPQVTPEERADTVLRGDGSTVAGGHPVLGAPIGTPAFVSSFLRD